MSLLICGDRQRDKQDDESGLLSSDQRCPPVDMACSKKSLSGLSICPAVTDGKIYLDGFIPEVDFSVILLPCEGIPQC